MSRLSELLSDHSLICFTLLVSDWCFVWSSFTHRFYSSNHVNRFSMFMLRNIRLNFHEFQIICILKWFSEQQLNINHFTGPVIRLNNHENKKYLDYFIPTISVAFQGLTLLLIPVQNRQWLINNDICLCRFQSFDFSRVCRNYAHLTRLTSNNH